MDGITSRDTTTWYPAWTQAVSDYRGEDDEPGFDDVTVRMTVPAAFGGEQIRVEFSNRYAGEPVLIDHAVIGVGGQFIDATFAGSRAVEIPAGESRWTDAVALAVRHGADIVVDIHLPRPTPYGTAGGFRFARSMPGDFAGAHTFPLEGSTPGEVDADREFPAANTGVAAPPDGTGWSLPAGGPFLRTIEVAGVDPRAVVVALGGSSTAMGWPQETAAQLPADAGIAVVNRGISGNRIRLAAPLQAPSWGESGLARFDADVLETSGVTHVVIAYNSNDWGLPGRVTSPDEMPTVHQLIDGYRELARRAEAAGLTVILATVTPLSPELRADHDREDIRTALNTWIRTAGFEVVDFDAAVRSELDPSRLDARYAAPDDTHPNINGEKRLAAVVAAALDRLFG